MNFYTRLRVLTVTFSFFFVIIIARLFYWQILTGQEMAAAADDQHFATLEITAKRGEILASDLTPLVTNQDAFLVFANVKKLKNPIVEIINKIGTASGDLTKPDAVWVPLKERVTGEEKDRIMNFKLPGIDYAKEAIRFYPEASSAAHLLGFVGLDENSRPKGYFGLEGFYERELAGKTGSRRLERDAFGRPLALSIETETPAEDGRTIITSIDKTVQQITDSYLKKGIETWGAMSGTVIVMDPFTGRIIANSSFPAYDPATYFKYPTNIYKNPAVAETYEPGSIMKPLIMAAAINENKLQPDDKCPVCSGPRSLGGGVIKTFNNQYHPNLTMTEVLINSDNTGMVYVGEKLGKDLLLAYLAKYQFGEKTGIDLQEEEPGRVKTEWYPLDVATVAFGQGIAVNPMQMVRGFAAIANGGFLVTPQVATKIGNYEIKPVIGSQVLSKETTLKIKEMLVQVNLQSPLHFPLDRTPGLSKFRIAAKSGTAQIPIAGSYAEDTKTIASGIGFAPADDPKFLVYVKLDEPAVRIWGSDTAGPIFYAIVHDLLLYYNISP
ncbi:MAG: penicillin-binding protein 2 [bacterium]|nr:penicillin-binding protein 2 [bacterium]